MYRYDWSILARRQCCLHPRAGCNDQHGVPSGAPVYFGGESFHCCGTLKRAFFPNFTGPCYRVTNPSAKLCAGDIMPDRTPVSATNADLTTAALIEQ